MRNYEKNLKTILHKTDNGNILVINKDFIIPVKDLHFLSAKGLIQLKPCGDNSFFVIPTSCGITYFSDKHDARINFIKENVFKFSAGFVSGVLTTICAALLLRVL